MTNLRPKLPKSSMRSSNPRRGKGEGYLGLPRIGYSCKIEHKIFSSKLGKLHLVALLRTSKTMWGNYFYSVRTIHQYCYNSNHKSRGRTNDAITKAMVLHKHNAYKLLSIIQLSFKPCSYITKFSPIFLL